ncbi:MAG: hypothetical protein AAFV51_03865 [Pseudomonadota bacterium]
MSETFTASADNVAVSKTLKKTKHPPPFSIRFTDEERTRLEQAAGSLALAAFIRLKLFEDMEDTPPKRRRMAKKQHSPTAELAMLSQMLGALGQSRLASNMNQIAKAANVGALPISPELEADLAEACAAIQEMRRELIAALGVTPR